MTQKLRIEGTELSPAMRVARFAAALGVLFVARGVLWLALDHRETFPSASTPTTYPTPDDHAAAHRGFAVGPRVGFVAAGFFFAALLPRAGDVVFPHCRRRLTELPLQGVIAPFECPGSRRRFEGDNGEIRRA